MHRVTIKNSKQKNSFYLQYFDQKVVIHIEDSCLDILSSTWILGRYSRKKGKTMLPRFALLQSSYSTLKSPKHCTNPRYIPMHSLQTPQARLLCGDSDYFWDSVLYSMYCTTYLGTVPDRFPIGHFNLALTM